MDKTMEFETMKLPLPTILGRLLGTESDTWPDPLNKAAFMFFRTQGK
jgi:hypothetical protein